MNFDKESKSDFLRGEGGGGGGGVQGQGIKERGERGRQSIILISNLLCITYLL